MLRTVFAMSVAGLLFATIPGAQAAPLLPLSAGVAAHLSDVTEVHWRGRCWRDRWGRMHCRTCWRDRWGRVRCR
jgi:hypothetical protein